MLTKARCSYIISNMNGFVNFTISACEGGFNWYGFLIGGAMVVCIVIAYVMATKRGYYKDLVFDICIICIPLAIVGARLYYIIFDIIGNPNHTEWTFKRIIGLESGGLSGLAIYGGLIGAVLGGVIVHFIKRKKDPQNKANFLQMADLAFTVIILGQVIGRWGNFANQEAFGNPVTNPSLQWFPYAVFIDSAHAARHGVAAGYYQATFFYESFLNAIGFGLLMWIYNGRRKSFDGFSLSVYLIWYGVVRFFIEGLRQDSLYLIPDTLRVSQLLSAVLVIVGVAIILAHMYRARAAGKKPFIMVDKDKLSAEYYGYEQSILSHPNVYDKTKKEKGFFAKLFAKTEATPDPEDEEREEVEPDEDYVSDDEPEQFTVTVPAGDGEESGEEENGGQTDEQALNNERGEQ